MSHPLVINTTALREFSGKYSQSAEAWLNVANQLQLILDQFDAEASSKTENKKPMPVTQDTRRILYNHLSGVAQACHCLLYTSDAADE